MTHSTLKRDVRQVARARGWEVTSGDSKQGQLDLVICAGGRYYEVDVKVGRDRLRWNQRAQVRKVQKAGGTAGEVRSPADLIAMVNGRRREIYEALAEALQLAYDEVRAASREGDESLGVDDVVKIALERLDARGIEL